MILNRVNTSLECRSSSVICQQDVEGSAVYGKERAVRDDVTSVGGITPKEDARSVDRADAVDVNLKAVVEIKAEVKVVNNTSEESRPREESGTRRNMVVTEAGKEMRNDGMRDLLGPKKSAMLDVEKHAVKLGRGCLLGELRYIQALEDLCDSEDCFAEHVVTCRMDSIGGVSDGTQLFLGYSEHINYGNFGERANTPELLEEVERM